MNVRLAAQTLSESVSAALKFCHECVPEKFQHPEETAIFCTMFNDAFDLLNVRSKFSKIKKCNMALLNETFDKLKKLCRRYYCIYSTITRFQQYIHFAW